MNAPPKRRLATAAIVLAVLAAAGLAVWWFVDADHVETVVRTEEVEMFDVSELMPAPVTPDPPRDTATDPLEQPQETQAPAPKGDLASLLQDPTASSSPFSGEERGQGGETDAPMIGGPRSGSGASRDYADWVQRQIMRHLREDKALIEEFYSFEIRVRISETADLEVVSLSDVIPPEMQERIVEALRSLTKLDRPPPSGLPNVITLRLKQTA